MTETSSTLDGAAEELYGLAPADFVGRRLELTRRAKAAGAGDVAKQIGALRRPTTSAWVANLLARDRPTEIAALLELGAALEDAQQSRSGDRLRSLAGDRRRQLDALVRAGLALADRAGQSARGALPTELRETLEAALGDPAVAEELRAGSLTVAHRPGAVGFGDWSPGETAAEDLASGQGTARPSQKAQRRTASRSRTGSAASSPSDKRSAAPGPKEAERARQSAARQRIRDAEKSVAEQQRALDSAAKKVASAQASMEDLARQLLELDQRRAQLQSQQRAATATVRDAERRRDRAGKARDTAVRHRDTTRRAAKD